MEASFKINRKGFTVGGTLGKTSIGTLSAKAEASTGFSAGTLKTSATISTDGKKSSVQFKTSVEKKEDKTTTTKSAGVTLKF